MKLDLRNVLLVMLLGVIVYGGLVVYAGLDEVANVMKTLEWGSVAFALLLSSANYGLRFFKWNYYLGKLGVAGIPKIDSLLVFLSGFVLTVTPAKVGEVFKCAVLAKTHGVALERTAPIIVAERLTDVIAVVLLIAIGSVTFQGGLLWAALGGAAVLIALLFIFWETPLNWLFRRLRTTWLARFVPKLEAAYQELKVLVRPDALGFPSVLSIVGWGAEGYGLFVLLKGLGQDVTAALSVFVYGTATLAGALVPLPGGLGIAEALIQEQLVYIGGVTAAAATASMILIRISTLWWAVAVGFAALALLRLRLGAQFLSGTAFPEQKRS